MDSLDGDEPDGECFIRFFRVKRMRRLKECDCERVFEVRVWCVVR